MKRITLCILAFCCAFSVTAYEIDAYKKPIPFYNYVTDIKLMLESGVKRNGWVLKQDENHEHLAHLIHKGYDIKVALNVENNAVNMALISAERIDCKRKCKVNNEKVQGWLLRLRRTVALEVTLAVKKSALKAYALSE